MEKTPDNGAPGNSWDLQSPLAARVPVSGWESAAAFTVYNPRADASPSREAQMPGGDRKGSPS
jgi:hypothetical protein